MNFEPQKFFIGLMDVFSIMLPGALLTYLMMGEVGPVVLGDRYCKLDGTEGWAAFLFASYLFGQLIFLLGSWLDEFYDWARRYTLNAQITRLARRGPAALSPPSPGLAGVQGRVRPRGGAWQHEQRAANGARVTRTLHAMFEGWRWMTLEDVPHALLGTCSIQTARVHPCRQSQTHQLEGG